MAEVMLAANRRSSAGRSAKRGSAPSTASPWSGCGAARTAHAPRPPGRATEGRRHAAGGRALEGHRDAADADAAIWSCSTCRPSWTRCCPRRAARPTRLPCWPWWWALMVSGVVPNVQAAPDRLPADGRSRLRRLQQRLRLDPLEEPGPDRRHAAVLPRPAAHRRRGSGGRRTRRDDRRRRGPRACWRASSRSPPLLGLFISNTATAVLMAPVALAVAEELHASPYPFAMIVALAASTAFMTPISSPVNTLVVGPGATASSTSCGSACRSA